MPEPSAPTTPILWLVSRRLAPRRLDVADVCSPNVDSPPGVAPHPPHQRPCTAGRRQPAPRFRLMDVLLISHEAPPCRGIGVDGLPDRAGEILLGARRPDRGSDDLARRHSKGTDHAQRPVANVFELAPFDLPWPHRVGGGRPFERLYRRQFNALHHASPQVMPPHSYQPQGAAAANQSADQPGAAPRLRADRTSGRRYGLRH
ncbi:MAG: hypothetical protein MI924_01445 [Chloroflexales bacterium]|nr:hypothetical protein [Chloroflexales bacterium]